MARTAKEEYSSLPYGMREALRAAPKAMLAKGSAGLLAVEALSGDLARVLRLGERGASVAHLTPELAWAFFEGMMAVELEATRATRWARSKEERAAAKAAREADDATRLEIWGALCRMGMPPARPAGLDLHVGFNSRPEAGQRALAALEAGRGGLMEGEAAKFWLGMHVGNPAPQPEFGGLSPLAFAFSKGLGKREGWSIDALNDVAIHAGDGCGINEALAALAAAGVRRLGAPNPDPEAKLWGVNGRDESVIGRLMHVGATGASIEAARRLGVDVFEVSGEGEPPIQALLGLSRSGRQADRLAGLLDAAEAAERGGAARMLAQRGKDGSGPMHWAAKAQCAEAVALLASFGADPNALDKAGKTAGHWAAKKWGEKAAKTMGPAVEALSRAGQDWSRADAKGESALAAFTKKARVEAIATLFEIAPEAARAKAGSAASALELLRARADAQAVAVAARFELGEATGALGGGQAGAASARRAARRM